MDTARLHHGPFGLPRGLPANCAGRITDHDATIGRLIARILAGGDQPHRTTVSESHLLDLERDTLDGLTDADEAHRDRLVARNGGDRRE